MFTRKPLCLMTLLASLTFPAHGAESKLELENPIEDLVIEDMSIGQNDHGTFLSTSLFSTISAETIVYYRVRWLDTDGNDLSRGTPWSMVVLDSQHPVSISGETKDPAAVDYRLQLRVSRQGGTGETQSSLRHP